MSSSNREYLARLVVDEVADLYHRCGLDQRVATLLGQLLSVSPQPSAAAPAAGAPSWDPYRVVGVEPGDPPEMIEAVYRAKARFRHPDNQQYGNLETFQRLHQAYVAVRRPAS